MSHRHSVNMPIRRSCSGEDRLTWRVQISQFSGTGVLWTPSGRSPARSLWLKALCFPSTLVLVNHTRHFFPLWARPLQSLYSPPGTNRITNFSAHRQRNVFTNEVQAVERSYQSTASWLLGYFTGSQVTNREGGCEGRDRIS